MGFWKFKHKVLLLWNRHIIIEISVDFTKYHVILLILFNYIKIELIGDLVEILRNLLNFTINITYYC